MTKRLICLCPLLLAFSTASASTAQVGAAPPMPPGSDFSPRVDNPWFPLVPGTRYVYTGVKDGKPSRDVVRVTRQTKSIAGARCIVVLDRLYLGRRLHERTTDWYSQDSRGNVWYFGERTAELDAQGRVTITDGTWMSGVKGAQPGVYMPADPRLGQTGRQELYPGQAEDHFRVIGVFRPVTGSSMPSTLLTEEWTPLEPRVLDHKLYVRGIGNVLEQTERGGSERNELVSLSRI